VFRAFRAAVEEHFTDWHHVADYAQALGYDVRTLTRATRAAAGTGAKAFLDQRILLEAKRLLAHTDLPVGGCARRLGFGDVGNFTTFFRRQAGTPPAAWRAARPGQRLTSFADAACRDTTRRRACSEDVVPAFAGPSRCSAQAASQETENVAFGVGQDVPGLLTGLADVGRARPELQEAFELGVLIAVGGVDVEVQPQADRLGLGDGNEDQSRLQSAEPFFRSDLHHAVVAGLEHDEAQRLAPERRQPLRIPALDHQFGNARSHDRHPTGIDRTRPILNRLRAATRWAPGVAGAGFGRSEYSYSRRAAVGVPPFPCDG
jgi:AraC-like DNA-binding protein